MLEKFKILNHHTLTNTPHCILPDRGHKDLELNDPAISVMIDHRLEKAPLIDLNYPLDKAIWKMAEDNCSMLIIEDEDHGVAGLITAADLTSEKPIQYVKDTSKKRKELKVKHLMTPIKDIPAISIQDVLDAEIGDILSTLNDIGSEFIFVTTFEEGKTVIRGAFSARMIARSLKIFFNPSPAAKSFIDFTKALHSFEFTH